MSVLVYSFAAEAVELKWKEGALLGFPEMTQADGTLLAPGQFSQRLIGNKLHVEATFLFLDGRSIKEQVIFHQGHELSQDRWIWEEKRQNQVLRRIDADFEKGIANAMKRENGKEKNWDEKIDVKRGQTFGGVGLSYAVRNLIGRLEKGERISLNVVSYSPKPRVVEVEIFRLAKVKLKIGGRELEAHHMVIHPKVGIVAKIVANPKDLNLWISVAEPPAVLRFEGSLQETDDPVVRTDTLHSSKGGN